MFRRTTLGNHRHDTVIVSIVARFQRLSALAPRRQECVERPLRPAMIVIAANRLRWLILVLDPGLLTHPGLRPDRTVFTRSPSLNSAGSIVPLLVVIFACTSSAATSLAGILNAITSLSA